MTEQPAAARIIRHYLDTLLSGDLAAIRACFAADAVWTMHGDLPIAGPWIGRDAIVDGLLSGVAGALFEPGSQAFEFPTLIAEGTTVALEWRVRGRSVRGADYDNEYCGFFVVRDGLIVEVREYLDTRYAARVLFPELG